MKSHRAHLDIVQRTAHAGWVCSEALLAGLFDGPPLDVRESWTLFSTRCFFEETAAEFPNLFG
jgi:hypothetical protein